MRNKLQHFSSAFPSGWPGVGLLLLRATAGATAIIEGTLYIGRDSPTVAASIVCVAAIVSGTSLTVGFLTPVASIVVGGAAICFAFGSFAPPAASGFEAALPTVLTVAVAAAVVFLGPGAISLDARRFGRREIIIPRTPTAPNL